MANRMLLHLGLRHRGVPHGPLLVDRGMAEGPLLVGCGMAEGPLLVGCGMAEGPLLTDGGSGRHTPSRWHHGRTMVPLCPDGSNKNAAQ